MWKGSYGKEPFDLRLTVLRLIRNLNIILALTAVGTLLFGGGYYVKKVLLRPTPEYSATSTYKVQYVVEPTKSGDYYINAATWETLVHTQEFIDAVQLHLQDIAGAENVSLSDWTAEELKTAISAKLPSDWHIPTITVVTGQPEHSVLIARAVELAMTDEFVEIMKAEVASVAVLDAVVSAEEVPLDVRPARAFILSAVLSFFFVTVVFLLKETGDDSIWLPATIRRRYGVPVVGTLNSVELSENIKFFFGDKEKVAVCSVDENVNPGDVISLLQKQLAERTPECAAHMSVWTAVPSPLLSPEVCPVLREADGVLLAVKAGQHAGKPLEYVLEYFQQQECNITAVILCEADELLIKAYYSLPGVTEKYWKRITKDMNIW